MGIQRVIPIIQLISVKNQPVNKICKMSKETVFIPTNPIGFMKFFYKEFCDTVIRVLNELTME